MYWCAWTRERAFFKIMKRSKLQDIPCFWQEFLYYDMFLFLVSCTSLSEEPGKRCYWVLYILLGKLVATAVGFYSKIKKTIKLCSLFSCNLIDVLATDICGLLYVTCFIITVMDFVCVSAYFLKRRTCQTDLWECAPSLQMASCLFGGSHLMEQASGVHAADPKVTPVGMERAAEGWAMLRCCKSDKTRKQEN